MPDLPRWILEVAFLLYATIVSGFVLLERRRPTATLALLLALIFVPVVGLGVYWLFSRSRVQRRRKQRRRRRIDPLEGTSAMAKIEALPGDLPPAQQGLVRLALASSAAPLRRADAAVLLPNARLAFDALEAAILQAEHRIHLEFYIWRDDRAGRSLTALLTERARQGLKVRVLLDHFGTLQLSNEHFAELVAAGGQVAVFGRLRLPIARSRLNFRNHRKLMVVDGRIGFTGGLNVGDEYLSADASHHGWRDLFVRIEGDAAVGLEATFIDDWLSATGEVLNLEGSRPREAEGIDGRKPPRRHAWQRKRPMAHQLHEANPFEPRPRRPPISQGPLIQIIPSGPDLPVGSALSAQFTAALALAQCRAYITTPYLIPDDPLMLVLRTAAMRGVDVRILVPDPRHNDSRLVAIAARSYYDELLEAGCRIYEYIPGMLHAKYLVADDIAAIGSANMDIRSFHINYEITAMFYDAAFTADLVTVFMADLEQASEVRPEHRLRLSLGQRLLEGSARLLSPLL